VAALGNAAGVAQLAAAGADLSATTPSGASALFLAAASGRGAAAAAALLARGAPADAPGPCGRAPLAVALETHGDSATVHALLAGGADASLPAPNGSRPVLTAARHLRVGALEALLAAGADPGAFDARLGLTPLMAAAAAPPPPRRPGGAPGDESRKRAALAALRRAGADLNAAVGDAPAPAPAAPGAPAGPPRPALPPHFRAVHFAISSSREEATVLALLEGPGGAAPPLRPAPAPGAAPRDPVLLAVARRGWARAAAALAAAGAPLEERDAEGFAALHVAALAESAPTVAALLAAGADARARAPDVWPDLASWKAARGARLAAALAAGPLAPGDAAALVARLDAEQPRASAVDLAVGAVQNIEVADAFAAAGARPGAAALELGARCMPLLRAVATRAPWSPELHPLLPPNFRAAAREAVRGLARAGGGPAAGRVPEDVTARILTAALWPLGAWTAPRAGAAVATAGWRMGLRVAERAAVERPGFPATPAAPPGGGPAAAAVHAGIHAMLPAMLPPLMAAVEAQVAQMADGGGAPGGGAPPGAVFINPGGGGGGGGAPGGALLLGGGAGAGAGLPPGLLAQIEAQLGAAVGGAGAGMLPAGAFPLAGNGAGVHLLHFQIALPGGAAAAFAPPGGGVPPALAAAAAAAAAQAAAAEAAGEGGGGSEEEEGSDGEGPPPLAAAAAAAVGGGESDDVGAPPGAPGPAAGAACGGYALRSGSAGAKRARRA
jgi:hypothetical protein